MENGVEIENAFDNAKIVDMSAHLWPLRFRSGHKRQLYPNEVRRVVQYSVKCGSVFKKAVKYRIAA